MKTLCWMTSVDKPKRLGSIIRTGLIAVLFLLVGCSPSPSYQKISGQTMGTTYHITAELDKSVNQVELERAINDKLESINASMSTWRKDSLISQFNRLQPGEKITVDDDFIEVLNISRQVYQASNKAFNPSVGALVKLWGFGPGRSLERFEQVPTEQEIEQAKQQVNFSSIANQGNMLIKSKSADLDFSAAAKGYAVDELANILQSYQIKNYMVEIGGEVATKGVNPRQQAWRIGIEMPDNVRGNVVRAISVNEAYMATSGDYRNYLEIEGKRYSHTIDPRTGYPIEHSLASVTVIADNVGLADAWATALTVVGKDEALTLAEDNQLAVYLIWYNEDSFETAYSSKMKPYLN